MTVSDSPTNSQRRRNPEEKRARLLAAARELFISQGFDGTTTKQIAIRSGVSEGILFHQFGSKVGLFKELIDVYAQGAVREFRGGASAELNSEVIIRRLVGYVAKNRAAFELIIDHPALLHENGIPTIAELIVPEIEKSIRALYPDVARLPSDPGVMARFQFSIVDATCRGWLESESEEQREAFILEGARSMNLLLDPNVP